MKMSKRLHPLYIAIAFIEHIKNNILPFVFVFIVNRHLLFTYWWATLLAGGVVALFAFFTWREFRYEVTETEVRLYKGIFKKEKRFIQRNRIQSLQLDQPFVFRILRLARLRIDTASSGTDAEIDLSGISLKEAHHLKDTLKLSGSQPEIREKSPERTMKVSVKQLALAAAFSGNFGYIFAALGFLYQYIDTYINRWVKTAYEEVIHQSMFGLFVLVAVIVVLAYLLSIVLYVIRFGGFTVERYDHYLHIKYGLLNKKSLTIPFHKIQAVTIEEGLVRRLFGWSSVSLNVVTSDLKEKVYLHPFIQQKKIAALMNVYVPHYEYVKCPRNTAIQYAWYPLLLPVLLFAAAGIGISFWKSMFVWIIAVLCLVYILIHWLGYRQGGLMMNDVFVSIRSQFLTRKTTIIRRKKIEEIEVFAGTFLWKKGYRKIKIATMGTSGSYKSGYFPFEIWHPIFLQATSAKKA